MKVLVTGVTGQIGGALMATLDRRFEVVGTDRGRLDLADPSSIAEVMRAVRPQAILNAAAFTSVDAAEAQPQLAHKVNAEAPGILAEEAKRLGAMLIHYSTDYVFDGALRRPYLENDPPNPISAYGASKLEGEKRVQASGCRHAILRVSWVYGGPRSFPLLMLEKAHRKEQLRIVDDQTGAPTWAKDIAFLTAAVLAKGVTGLWHAGAAGEVTRYEYVLELLRLRGIEGHVVPIATSDFPAPARRPAYSALDSRALAKATGIPAIGPWRERLAAWLRGA